MNWYIILVLLIAILALTTFIAARINSKAKKIKEDKKQENQNTIKRILNINRKIKNPKESLLALNKISKDFFKLYLKDEDQETYSEMETALRKKGKIEMAEFCEKLDYLLYSGKEITKAQAIEMIEEFTKIIKHKKEKVN